MKRHHGLSNSLFLRRSAMVSSISSGFQFSRTRKVSSFLISTWPVSSARSINRRLFDPYPCLHRVTLVTALARVAR